MNKNLEYYMSLPYTIELIPDEDGTWFAQIPVLPGCMTVGPTREAALQMLDEAKQLWLEAQLELHQAVPEPQSVRE